MQMMCDIYGQAERVILWWGPEKDDSSIAMKMIHALGTGSVKADDFETWDVLPELETLDGWNALNDLFRRPFWHRSWILQEIVLGKELTVLCGNEVLPWSVLEAGFHRWDEALCQNAASVWNRFGGESWKVTNNSWDIMRTVLTVRQAHQRTDPAVHILYMLENLFELDATDPRDKIFSLLGVTEHKITANYALSAREVYTTFANGQIEQGQGAILLFAGSGVISDECKTCQLPSWVPDWKGRVKSRLHSDYLPYSATFRAAFCDTEPPDQGRSSITTSTDSNILQGKAIFCQQVTKVLPPPFDDKPDFWDQFLSTDARTPYKTGVSALQALLRTFLFDVDRLSFLRIRGTGTLYYDLIVGFLANFARVTNVRVGDYGDSNHRALAKDLFKLDQNSEDSQVDDLLFEIFGKPSPQIESPWPFDRGQILERTLLLDFTERFLFHALQRSFFWTVDGYFGLGPKGCRNSDIACAFMGRRALHMLRSHEGYFEYVGPCFMLGFMDGEALELVEKGTLSVQDICIR